MNRRLPTATRPGSLNAARELCCAVHLCHLASRDLYVLPIETLRRVAQASIEEIRAARAQIDADTKAPVSRTTRASLNRAVIDDAKQWADTRWQQEFATTRSTR